MIIEEVKILRLKTGEDIVAFVSELDDMKLNVKYPMVVDNMVMRGVQSFSIGSWLPYQMYKQVDVNLWTNDILFTADITDDFLDYYFKMVDKLEKYILAGEVLDNIRDQTELMEAVEEKELSIVH